MIARMIGEAWAWWALRDRVPFSCAFVFIRGNSSHGGIARQRGTPENHNLRSNMKQLNRSKRPNDPFKWRSTILTA